VQLKGHCRSRWWIFKCLLTCALRLKISVFPPQVDPRVSMISRLAHPMYIRLRHPSAVYHFYPSPCATICYVEVLVLVYVFISNCALAMYYTGLRERATTEHVRSWLSVLRWLIKARDRIFLCLSLSLLPMPHPQIFMISQRKLKIKSFISVRYDATQNRRRRRFTWNF
jgi:hypothetical protein